ncbi:hypothetical protein H2203_008967 [Taxawa tesnikishii (nom. ined.)]|nr:hypothetical protein H2203_008967 [Dothideales sp. JES 119]
MSLSAALDAEAKELRREDEREKEEQKKRRASARNASPAPQSANSSTLDVGPNSPVTRHASIAGPTTGLTSSWARNLAPPKRNEDSESDDASAYDFVMGASAGKAAKPSKPNAMASVYGNTQVRLPGDLGASDPRRPKIPGDLGPNDPRRRRTSTAGPKSASPTGRSPRNMSPAISKLNQSSSAKNSLAPGAQKAPDGGVRLQNDDDEDDEAVESSDDEDDMDTDASTDSRRGRRRTREGSSAAAKQSEIGEGEPGSSIDPEGEARKDRGLLQAPDVTVTPAPGASPSRSPARKGGVHPSTAFDQATSAASSPMHSDDEEHLTPSAHRVIRQIIRGDYTYFQREAEDGRRRQRVYLVATDLSPEAEYALEWTIGTVLRDGDTLLAVYAVDEEEVGGSEKVGVEIGHGADVVKDTASVLSGIGRQAAPQSPGPSPLGRTARESSTARVIGAEGDARTKAEKERFKSAEAITDRCVRLLRKTKLQVRVVVEVFHCKSPKHMITEVIDFLSPTLTILGSRGRSALKGVLLGSFSNYLVTKSSVPVMVARKRLRKHSKTRRNKDGLPIAASGDGRMRIGRMSNVLEAPSAGGKKGNRLAGAKVD